MTNKTWDAKEYAKNSKGQEVWAKELIKKLYLDGTESILDIGCGDGKITNMLANLTSGRVVGIDASEEMISLAKSIYKKPTFLQMDALKMNFKDEFDFLFSNAALHWIKDQKTLLKGVHKALKKGGRILFQMGGAGNARVVFSALDLTIPSYKRYFKDFDFPYAFYDDKFYLDLLKRHNFRDIEVNLIKKDMIHDDILAFKGWLETTWFPYLNVLPKNLRENFLAELIENYIKLSPLDSQNRVHIDMVRLEVNALKGE